MNFCTTCGSQLQGEDFCTSCGTRVTTASAAAPTHYAAPPDPPDVSQATQHQPASESPPRGGVPSWVLIGAIVGIALVAVVVFVLMSRGSGGETAGVADLAAPPVATTAQPSVAVMTVTATATATTAPTRTLGSPTSFVEALYQDWSARNQAGIAAKVSPAYVAAFPSSLLDGQGITRVESYNNVESSQNGATRVCGNQRFVKTDGESQVEYRCFLLTDSNGTWKVLWTGDSETLQRWS